MASADDIIKRVRVYIQDTAKTLVPEDADLLAILNNNLAIVHDLLVSIESNLVYGTYDITTAAGQQTYTTVFTYDTLRRDGLLVAGERRPLGAITEAQALQNAGASGKPRCYFLRADQKIGFWPVPDAVYTITASYQKPPAEITDTQAAMPYNGLFDTALALLCAIDAREINERDSSLLTAKLQPAWNLAVNKAYQYGTNPMRTATDFFSAPGL